MDFDYWLRQTDTPLFPDIEWAKPERKSLAGKLAIIGGHSGGMLAVAESYREALAAGVGETRAVLPNTFSKTIPANATDTIFVPTNPSGGMGKESLEQLRAAVNWADATLLIGDSGRNSETAIMFETLLRESSKPFIITRDAVDLLKNNTTELVNRPGTTIIASFAQTQKLLQSLLFPKQLLFSMQLAQVVEVLHKFTLSFTCTLVTFHQEQLIAAHDGRVVTTPFGNPMSIWRGSVATKAAVYLLQHQNQPFEAIVTSFLS